MGHLRKFELMWTYFSDTNIFFILFENTEYDEYCSQLSKREMDENENYINLNTLDRCTYLWWRSDVNNSK